MDKGLVGPLAEATCGAEEGVMFGAEIIKLVVASDEADQDRQASSVQLEEFGTGFSVRGRKEFFGRIAAG